MIFLSELIEWVACLTEIGLLSWLFWEAFKEQRKNAGMYWDCIYVVCMATWVLFINNIVLYSTFTLVQLVVISSTVARALYRGSYRKLLSASLFYTFCFCSADMLVSSFYLSKLFFCEVFKGYFPLPPFIPVTPCVDCCIVYDNSAKGVKCVFDMFLVCFCAIHK